MDYGPRYKLFTFLSVNQNKLEIILKKNSVLTLYLLVLSTGRLEEGEKVDVGGGGEAGVTVGRGVKHLPRPGLTHPPPVLI